MTVQQPHQIIDIDPDFGQTFLLAFVKNQLHTEMQMDSLDVIDVFLIGIPRTAHESNQVTCLHGVTNFKAVSEGLILLKMRIIIVTL